MGIVVLGATNRPEILDAALLRPGRFDRRITVDLPDLRGREAVLRVHARDITTAKDIDYAAVARATVGASGADLANIVNEAALRAVRMGRKAVNQQDLLTSFELVIAGTEKKGTVLTDTEKRIVSYHEVGHALVAALREDNARLQSKAVYYDLFIDLRHSTNLRTTAKELDVPERRFIRFLLERRYVYRTPSGCVLPYAKGSNEGLFCVKDFCRNGHTGSYTLVTPKGKLHFAELRQLILVTV